jgi:hypothetical protein
VGQRAPNHAATNHCNFLTSHFLFSLSTRGGAGSIALHKRGFSRPDIKRLQELLVANGAFVTIFQVSTIFWPHQAADCISWSRETVRANSNR